ncbi:MAG: GMC family oxidoreductase [Tepidisphaeraceae bacterium]
MDHYDVIIIGTGAGGGTLAHRLAPSGKKILLLERGDYVPREQDNWNSGAVNLRGKYQAKESWLDRHGKPLHPHTNYNVGGNTKFYGAALFRFRKEDFGELQHHGGASPAWPITYDELEPYYTQAEAMYHVHGTRGEDPTEPWASGPYPHSALAHEPRIQKLHDDLMRVGRTPFHVPVGVMYDSEQPRTSKCIKCGTCDGYPCLLQAKADAETCAVEPALRHSNVTLITGAHVDRLVTDAAGHEVHEVHVTRHGERAVYRGSVVVVSCGAIHSAALLLRSKSDRHPNGLANGSDVVGRHYMGHVNSVLLAISREANPTVFQKTLGLNDYYFGDDEFPHPMGHISFVGKLDAVTLSAGAPPFAPGWTLEQIAKHSLDFWLTSEDLPDPENRVTVNADGKVVLSYRPNNEQAHKELTKRLKYLLNHLDCHEHLIPRNLFLGQRIPLAGVAHQNGTIRFGEDAQTSALDRNCCAHEVRNLYVVDGSFFPSSAAVNPALTIMANALRVGDHLLKELS